MNMLEGKNNYQTKDTKRTLLLDKLFFGSRWSFYMVSYLSIIKSGLSALFGKLSTKNQIRFSSRNLYLIEELGGKLDISGLENITGLDTAVMLIGNHMSMLETAMLPSIIAPRMKFTFIIKQSLMKVPFLNFTMKSMKAIPITRSNPREDFKKVLKDGRKLLKGGTSVLIFPQGTRTREFDSENFSSIGVKLAKAAKVPVVPFALKTDFVDNGRCLKGLGPIKRNRKVCFAFGEPIVVNGTGKEAHAEVISFIQSKLNEWSHFNED